MRIVFILLTLILLGCKPDPIEACVEAHTKKERLQSCTSQDTGKDICDRKSWQIIVTILEPGWREKCMRAAAGKED